MSARGCLVAGDGLGLELRRDVLWHLRRKIAQPMRKATLALRSRKADLDRLDDPGCAIPDDKQRTAEPAPACLEGMPSPSRRLLPIPPSSAAEPACESPKEKGNLLRNPNGPREMNTPDPPQPKDEACSWPNSERRKDQDGCFLRRNKCATLT